MAARKTTTKPAEPDAAPAEPVAVEDLSYAGRALQLGADARALADATRRELDDLADRFTALLDTAHDAHDAPLADRARRIPMTANDLDRAMAALAAAGADLMSSAQR